MSFELRRPAPADAQTLSDLHWQTWQQTYTHLLPEDYFSEQNYQSRLAFWRRALADDNPALRLRVAQDDAGALIGFVFAGPPNTHRGEVHPSGLQLYSLYVLSEYHGSGVGQALFDAALGQDPAVLWVAKENPRAISFYRRNGFDFDGTQVNDPHAPKIVDLRMARS